MNELSKLLVGSSLQHQVASPPLAKSAKFAELLLMEISIQLTFGYCLSHYKENKQQNEESADPSIPSAAVNLIFNCFALRNLMPLLTAISTYYSAIK